MLVFLSLVFVFAFVAVTPTSAKNTSNYNYKEHLLEFNINAENITIQNEDSLKCWVFRQWIKSQLNKVSDDKELINATADALKELCEIANDLGIL